MISGLTPVEIAEAYANLSPDEQAEFDAIIESCPEFFDPTVPRQAAYLADTCRFKCVLCARRSGKSTAAAYEMLQAAWEVPGCSVLYVGLTRESAKRIMVKDALRPVARKLGIKLRYNKSQLSFELENGSIIYLLGLDQDEGERNKVFGQKFALVILDEAALYTIDLRVLIDSTLRPAVSDYIKDGWGRIVMMGMPSVMPKGPFYEATKAQDPSNPGTFSFTDTKSGIVWSGHRWTWRDNPYVRDDMQGDLDGMVRVSGPTILDAPSVKREWFGIWGLVGEAFFPPNPHVYRSLPPLMRRGIGLDLAYTERKRSDWNIAVVLGEFERKWYVIEVLRRQMKADAFADELKKLEARYPGAPVRMYGSGVEQGVVDLLNKLGCHIGFVTTTQKKFQRALPVSGAWGRGEIILPDTSVAELAPAKLWLPQFKEVVEAFDGSEIVPAGTHDDDPDALAAAFDVTPSTWMPPPAAGPAPGSPEWCRLEDERMRLLAINEVKSRLRGQRQRGWKR